MLNPFRTLFLAFSLMIITFNGYAAPVSDPCSGVNLLSLTDRGGITNTACVIPSKDWMLETGYTNLKFTDLNDHNYPQTIMFLGLPSKTELIVELPTYNQQAAVPFSGFSATAVGFKHEFTYGQSWVTSGVVMLTPPGGSAGFGSQGWGTTAKGLFTYTISPKVSISALMEWTTTALPSLFGGGRYNSVNPSMALYYAPIETVILFIETFAQTKTLPNLGANFNADGGFLYLLTPNIVLDLELGQQLGHEIASFNQYIGAGITIQF